MSKEPKDRDMTLESALGILDEVSRGVFTNYKTSRTWIRNETQAVALACLVLFEARDE